MYIYMYMCKIYKFSLATDNGGKMVVLMFLAFLPFIYTDSITIFFYELK